MEDPDQDTLALARRIHLELNGLTRQRRGKPALAVAPAHIKQKTHSAGAAQTKPKHKRSNSSSHDKQPGKRRRSSDGEDDAAPSSKPRTKKEQPAASDSSNSTSRPGRHRQQDSGQGTAREKGADATPHHAAARQQHQQPAHHQQQQLSDTSGHSQRALQQHQQPSPGGPPPWKPVTPAAAAALVAAQQVKLRLKGAADTSHPGEADSKDMVKVFFAGVRWGVLMSRKQISSRSSLARTLNEAFVGEILSVGRGMALTAVFLDAGGVVKALGPLLANPDPKADAQAWQEAASTAVRVYVHGPASELLVR